MTTHLPELQKRAGDAVQKRQASAPRRRSRELDFEPITPPGPHELTRLRFDRAERFFGTHRVVAICLCGYETAPHQTPLSAERAFSKHQAWPWVCLGF